MLWRDLKNPLTVRDKYMKIGAWRGKRFRQQEKQPMRWKQVHLAVVDPPRAQTPTEELVADLLSIVTVLSGRVYGSRAKNVRSCLSHALKNCLKAEAADGAGRQNNQTLA